jgi:anthranilate synthase component 1
MDVVRYSHVMHLRSTVGGRVRDGVGPVDILRATFPAGTLSGAPKVRAMQIIDELEPTRRGLYGGGIGYLDLAGNLDLCIAIRTLVFRNGAAHVQVGAGVVADSVAEREYAETQDKAMALLASVRAAERL